MQQIIDTVGNPSNLVGDNPPHLGFKKCNDNFTDLYGAVLTSGAANLIQATPDGTSGLPSLRALAKTDLPSNLGSKVFSNTRATAQTGANASVATTTVGASDATFLISANVLVTTATTHAFTVTCAYTDEGNTARTATLSFTLVAGTAIVTSVANAAGAVPYQGLGIMIRCKAATTITIATTGTFTTVVYNVEGSISQIS